jgi:hypothetical protein
MIKLFLRITLVMSVGNIVMATDLAKEQRIADQTSRSTFLMATQFGYKQIINF